MKATLVGGVVLVVLLVGCSGQGGRRVWGKVSWEGEPIREGDIEFIPIEGTGGPSVGGLIRDGAYDLPAARGPLAGGTYRVELRAVRDTGRFPPGPRHPKALPEREPIFPPEYNVQSKLRVTVRDRAGENQFDFHLK
jgi:hypothetical protein